MTVALLEVTMFWKVLPLALAARHRGGRSLLAGSRGRALWYFNYEDAETSKNVATIVIDAQTGKVTLADVK